MSDVILEMRNITKEFPGVTALKNVSFSVRRGEIHALVGENGAGKSTLMEVLSGVHPYGSYSGDIYFEGKECQFRDITQSEAVGLVIIHQELALIPFLSIAENLFLGNERAKNGIIDWNKTISDAEALLKKVGLKESHSTLITNMGVGKQQQVEIAKALAKEVRLLILDEPTASLNESDSEKLLELLLQLKENGISSILISHKIGEVSKVADSITILRDGATIETLDCAKETITEDRIIRGMVGRDLTHRFPERKSNIGETIFEIRDWNVYHPLHTDRKVSDNINISVRRGEVVGISGLMGSGRTELAMSIFGEAYGTNISGTAYKNGEEIDISTIEKAISNGIAYATEDRKAYGLILIDQIKDNITLANLDAVAGHGVINEPQEMTVTGEYRDKLGIKCSSILQLARNLSGGNQQKVVLSKWLFANPEILFLDEPTRGIDVGAKYEIYTIINQLASEGKGIFLISSELPEILGICDRIYVMREGKIVAEMQSSEATQEKVMKYILTNKR
ncbi:multiple monosaccharide ABC transporter ATP-binding protein [Pelolinea submarina]|uniref:Multiple monosaccharide ABC transporter ATP-binding protein n=1 Tax=Pelolinea submarina TaxID=913107 RepID=A0A347ZU72_9CHLR|nr:multiple monosaccharide ABC transporter ATP-binding protein [Pelolinea submarina]REG10565.1 multiple monosaccharide ABC transporter ATP-binding protein [Pelolinea submarina]BBB48853.1 multiple sugar transport system ATP-binding protein [Pelolinea submarina]